MLAVGEELPDDVKVLRPDPELLLLVYLTATGSSFEPTFFTVKVFKMFVWMELIV